MPNLAFPAKCCMCLGPSERALEIMGLTRKLGNQTETAYLKFPLCAACWKIAYPLRILGWGSMAALLIGGSLLLARFKDNLLLIGIGIALLAATLVLIGWFCLGRSQPGTVGWKPPGGISDALFQEITGWRKTPDGGFAAIPTENELRTIDTFYLPIFRNQEYQALFERANGLKNPFGLPFGPELRARIAEEAKKRRRGG